MKAKDFRTIGHNKFKLFSGRLIVLFFIIGLFLSFTSISINVDITEIEKLLFELGVEDASQISNLVSPILIFLGYISLVTSVASILIPGPFTLSKIIICEKAYEEVTPEYSDMFAGFKDFKRAFLANLLIGLYISLWSMISFGILGFIKSYSYSMTFYILREDPYISANDAITASRKMMDGNKMPLFVLDLSYIGWYILNLFTLGILSLWITPKYEIARYAFFRCVDGRMELARDSVTNNYQETIVE